MHAVIKVGKNWLPIIAQVILGVSIPLLNPNVTVKQLAHIHKDMNHADHAQMAIECTRLGCKMNKSMELRISRVIQECTVCKHEDEVFSQGQGKKYKTVFNTDVLVRQEPVRNDFYYTDLFSLECLHTGYITARYVNSRKYESKYEMVNKVVTKYWVYGEYGDGFGTPRNAFSTAEETDDICRLHQAGRSENLKCGRSDLKLGKFKFPEFLDCKHEPRTTDLQMRLSDQVFVRNDTLGPGIGYTPQLTS